MTTRNTIENKIFDEERALYGSKNVTIEQCSFDGPADGESALKECSDIEVRNCYFNLRYPFWHVNHALIINTNMTENCRAALWYDEDIQVENTKMHGIKAFRECKDISIKDCDIISPEFLWRCDGITFQNSKMDSQYALFESKNIEIDHMSMTGKYSFQYVENMTIRNSVLDTKDAFWHGKNVTVYDSVVKGEYLGWYAENLRFVRCKIIGTQPLCYCKNLVLEDCTMEETDFSFERSEVQATIHGSVLGIKNPWKGKIVVDEIQDLLLESEYIDPDATEIICDKIVNKALV